MAETPVKKVLTVTIEIEVDGSTTRTERIKGSYEAIVEGALDAAHKHLPPGSITMATTQGRWEYRHWYPRAEEHPGGEYRRGD